jgi:hypothetical protein
MNEYHKIQTIFKRDPSTRYKTLLLGKYSRPEFEFLAENDWVFTEKVDGTNIRIIFTTDRKRIEFYGKSDNAQIPAQLANRLNEKFLPQLDVFKNTFQDGVCLYCEGYGAKIQKSGGKYRANQYVVLFDVKIGEWWLNREAVENIGALLNLDVVPVVGTGTLNDAVEKVQAGFNSQWGDFTAEGIVARPATELKGRDGERIITKIKHRDFLRK